MIATETIVPVRKLKIKFSSKTIDYNGCCNLKEKPSVPSSNKRRPQDILEGQKEKRQKLDRKVSLQCATILKSLMAHPYSWVFGKPVDPVALNIPDYFTIISEPMDLGTIKSKLEKKLYYGIEEFAADVRLTFSNAMTYNPPSNDVHLMAKELNKIFERKWKDLEKKWACEDEHGKCMTGAIKETVRKSCKEMVSLQKDVLPQKLPEQCGNQKRNSSVIRDDKVDGPKSSHIPHKVNGKSLYKGNKYRVDGGHLSGSAKACPSLSLITSKCSICGEISCHCVLPSDSTCASSDVCSEGSEERGQHAFGAGTLGWDCQAKCISPCERKSDPDSDGAVSALDSEHVCSSSQLTTATDSSAGEVWSTPVCDVQLSPKKALRAAMMKSRFADTILKAQQKTLLDHGDKADFLKMQQEKERLERIQREERARLEAQIKAVEAAEKKRAEEELKQQREKEREAARVAIQKMERTTEFNLEIFKELEMLIGCKLSCESWRCEKGSRIAIKSLNPQISSPLERLGLFLKDEYMADDEEVLNGGCEDGEIL
ncbi:transcription factor GTE12 [Senna tora]|uniref:Transcription factor GTE12 n=1 Tax=Senna tora TaxID=362788 RepID=A0A835CFM4_9FABA|nr:transcription factor GTE12 [Senna tora]